MISWFSINLSDLFLNMLVVSAATTELDTDPHVHNPVSEIIVAQIIGYIERFFASRCSFPLVTSDRCVIFSGDYFISFYHVSSSTSVM